jgi:CDP-diacylglycerol--glycerol-3-phosphate 3-phosphatidyltransferase
MLDTHCRKYLDKYFDTISDCLINLRLKPTHVTCIALVIGILASLVYYINNILLAIILLWFSGFLDAVDGTMARKMKAITKSGTLLDICFDRVVELVFIIVFALKHQDSTFALLCLTCAIVLSMSVFLTSGMLLENNGKKSFYYQAGLMERTEGFIMFTIMMILNSFIKEMAFIYAALVLFTAIQRLIEAINAMEETNEK